MPIYLPAGSGGGAPASPIVLASHNEISVSNSTTKTTLVDLTVPGGTLGNGDLVVAEVSGEIRNTSGNAADFTWEYTFGATSITTGAISIESSASNYRRFVLRFVVHHISTFVQKVSVEHTFASPVAFSSLGAIDAVGSRLGVMAPNEDESTDLDILVSLTLGTADPTISGKSHRATLLHYPA